MKINQKTIQIGIYISAFFLILVFILSTLGFVLPATQNSLFNSKLKPHHTSASDTILTADKVLLLKKEKEQRNKKLASLSPGRQYLVINTTNNSFEMFVNNHLVRKGICSTGSYIELQAGDRIAYKFETPKGIFTIKSKLVDPVWKKPDWAFLEEGLPVPPPNDDSRFEYGVLGDYALNIGNGYLIHGTLYQRFLGLPVTHGCVRLNDSDLEFLYKEMPVGAKVFIY